MRADFRTMARGWASAETLTSIINADLIRGCGMMTALVVSEDRAFFHDKEHLLGNPNVPGWIARHCDDVRDFARLERPQAGCNPKQFGIGRCARDKSVDGAHPSIHQLVELFCVASMGIYGRVSSHPDSDALGERSPHGLVYGGNSGCHL